MTKYVSPYHSPIFYVMTFNTFCDCFHGSYDICKLSSSQLLQNLSVEGFGLLIQRLRNVLVLSVVSKKIIKESGSSILRYSCRPLMLN